MTFTQQMTLITKSYDNSQYFARQAVSNVMFFVHDIYVMVCIFSSNQKPLFVNLDLGFGNSTSKFSWFSQ